MTLALPSPPFSASVSQVNVPFLDVIIVPSPFLFFFLLTCPKSLPTLGNPLTTYPLTPFVIVFILPPYLIPLPKFHHPYYSRHTVYFSTFLLSQFVF